MTSFIMIVPLLEYVTLDSNISYTTWPQSQLEQKDEHHLKVVLVKVVLGLKFQKLTKFSKKYLKLIAFS